MQTLAVSGSTVYVGGNFSMIGASTRNNLAAIDTAGTVLAWNPAANGMVKALTISGSTVFAGGDFTCFGNCGGGSEGVDKWSRNRLAAIDSAGAVQTWNPDADGSVTALAFSGQTLYAGGSFTTAGGQTRNRLAAADISTACLTAYTAASCFKTWNPNANGQVKALLASGPTVYIAGVFATLSGGQALYMSSVNSDGSLNW